VDYKLRLKTLLQHVRSTHFMPGRASAPEFADGLVESDLQDKDDLFLIEDEEAYFQNKAVWSAIFTLERQFFADTFTFTLVGMLAVIT